MKEGVFLDRLEFIYNRHSVRKFKDQDIPMEDIRQIIHAATYAPSGKNSQNWHFVVIRNKEKLHQIAEIIEKKNAELAQQLQDEEKQKSFIKFSRFATFFKNAPVVILVYAGPYMPTGLDVLEEIGAPKEEIEDLCRPNPGIQSVGAAIENLLLAASALGYGGCWMTSPNYAAKEISDFIGFQKEGYYYVAMVPLGVPEGEIKSPPRKDIEEVMTIIE